jgi:6-phosphogluconolactonase (cycloisomerase 2 family)
MFVTRGVRAGWMLLLPLCLAGCKGFWDQSGSNFALTNSGTISVSAGATSGNTSTISVTPSNSFTGTVALACAVTTSPSSAASPVTCSLSPSSVTISSTAAQTATLTASTTSATTTGAYEITVTGTSGSASATTNVCVAVGTSSSNCSSASTSGNFYILGSSSISGYTINAGSVTALSNSFYSNLTGASAIAINPNGGSLYVAVTGDIFLYSINTTTGALTQQSATFGDPVPGAIQVDPSGRWLLDASATGTLYAFPITSSGTLDTSRTVQTIALAGTSVQPGGIAISPNGALVVVALGSTGTEAFPFAAGSNSPIGNPYSNLLTPYGRSAGSAVAVAIDPQSRFLYIGETAAFPNSSSNSGALRVFKIGTNSLTEFSYSTPYAPTGTGPHAILPIATGGYVYVASWQSGSTGVITGYSVTTSSLTPLSTTSATGVQPYGLVEDSTGNFLLAVSNSGTTFSAYTMDSSTGQLSTAVTSSPVSNAVGIVAAP